MNPKKFALYFLHTVGLLLIVLGLVHLIATPHIPGLLEGSSSAVYQRAIGPTLLNHVLVGILLIPLGYTTWLAAGKIEEGELWPKRILIVNTFVMFTLPVSVLIFMRQPEYYTAPLFLSSVGLVGVISILMFFAVAVILKTRATSQHE